MAWYDSAWDYRIPLTFANNTDSNNNLTGAAAPEGQIAIPGSFGRFWDTTTGVLSSFNDVRVTAADGKTPLDWAFHGGTPSKTNRTCTIQIDETNHNVSNLYGSAAANASVGAWLYWGNDSNNLTSGANNSINITTTPKTVSIDLVDPRTSANSHYLRVNAMSLGQTYYPHEIRKGTADITRIYWDLSTHLMRFRAHNHESKHNEQIAYVTCIIYDQDGADTTAAMTTKNDIKILPGGVVSMPIKGGDHEKRYSIIMTFGTVDHEGSVRVTEQRATLHVRNPGLHPALTTT